MLLKPFAISEISDPSQVRVVLYSGEALYMRRLMAFLIY